MIMLNLEKPIKIVVDAPKSLSPDYETIGKVIDNIIVMAHSQKMSLTEVGKVYSCDFVVGKKSSYKADFIVNEKYYGLVITYVKELKKYEASRPFAVTPKEKLLVEEAKNVIKDNKKEKKNVMKEKKVKKIKEVKKDDYPDLD